MCLQRSSTTLILAERPESVTRIEAAPDRQRERQKHWTQGVAGSWRRDSRSMAATGAHQHPGDISVTTKNRRGEGGFLDILPTVETGGFLASQPGSFCFADRCSVTTHE